MSVPYGMKWLQRLYYTQPVWTAEPDTDIIESIARTHLRIPLGHPCVISFLTAGTFSKIFKIDTNLGSFVMRVALPLHMPHKTQSEVAVADFLRDKTSAPIARIYAYDASNDNPLRFPWLLMDYIPGYTVHARWRKMTQEKREALIRDVARFQSEVYSMSFGMIGNVYQKDVDASATPNQSPITATRTVFLLAVFLLSPTSIIIILLVILLNSSPSSTSNHSKYYIGPTVSLDMLRATASAPRGPYSCTYDWFQARLMACLDTQAELIQGAILENTEESLDDAYRYRQTAAWARELLRLLPRLVNPCDEQAAYHLFLSDLNARNIMVDGEGNLLAILDFEFIQTTPAWRCCCPPRILEYEERSDEPDMGYYGMSEEDVLDAGVYVDDPDEDENRMYWEALLDYQLTKIMPVYEAEMDRLQPGFLEEYRSGSKVKEFDQAIKFAEHGRVISNRPYVWLHKVKLGEDTSGLLDQFTSMKEYKHLVYGNVESYPKVGRIDEYLAENGAGGDLDVETLGYNVWTKLEISGVKRVKLRDEVTSYCCT